MHFQISLSEAFLARLIKSRAWKKTANNKISFKNFPNFPIIKTFFPLKN